MRAAGAPRPLVGYLALFSSLGTLVCCALPALLVLLGFGATVASLLSAAPWLVTLSQHKGWVFAFAGILMTSSFYYVYRIVPRLLVARGACAADDMEACRSASRGSRVLLWLSTVLLVIGVSVAYVLPVVLEQMDA
jgi:mercuric ion transport protein